MKTIWKYPMPLEDEITFDMPKGARVLSVQVQAGKPYIWAVVDPAREREQRFFSLRGTGHPDNGAGDMRFIGTFQLAGGGLVFHLFEPESLFHKGSN